jgi:hypothetical protein
MSKSSFPYIHQSDGVPENIKIMTNEVDALYLEKICQLPTKIIEGIILADERRKFGRARNTIEVLKNELTARALLKS